jgi:hypothetical protein
VATWRKQSLVTLAGMRTRLHRRRFLVFAGAAAGSAILAACGGSTATDTPKPAVPTTAAPTTAAPTTAAASAAAGTGGLQTMVVEAFDFGFKTMGSIPGGLTRVQLQNTGKEGHHAQFMLLNPGVSPEQIGAAFQKGAEEAFKFASFVGGPGAIVPGGAAEVLLNLKEGQYMLACIITGADNIPHLAKGMVLPLKVSAPATAAPAPQVNGTINMVDFNYEMPATLPVGKSMWRITNTGAQFHELAVWQLMPGKTVDDFTKFFDAPRTASPSGPPPALPMGGMQALTRGNEGILALDLKGGDYVATCFIPDQSKPNGDSHLHLGMIKGFHRQVRRRSVSGCCAGGASSSPAS